MAAALRIENDDSPMIASPRRHGEQGDIYARRGEDPPTRLDGVLRCFVAVVQVGCMMVCLFGTFLFAGDSETPSKPIAVVICATIAAGFAVQAVRSARRAIGIFRASGAQGRGFDVE